MSLSTSAQNQVLELESRRELLVAFVACVLGFLLLLGVQAWVGRLRLEPTLELLAMMIALATVVFVRDRERLTVSPSGLSRQCILPISRLNWSVAWSAIRSVELRRAANGSLEARLRMTDGSMRPLWITAWVLRGQIDLRRRLQQLRRERKGSSLFGFLDPSRAEEAFRSALAERPLYAALRERDLIDWPEIPQTRGYPLEHNRTIVTVLVVTLALAIYVFAELSVTRYQYSAPHAAWLFVALGMLVFPLCMHLIRRTDAPLPESIGVALLSAAVLSAACYFLALRLNAAPSPRGRETHTYELTAAGTLFHPASGHVVEMTFDYYRDCIRRQAGGEISVHVIDGLLGFKQIDERALMEILERTCQRPPQRAR